MSTETDCIVLSTSPDHGAIGNLTLPVEMKNQTIQQNAPFSPSPSPLASAPPPTRSRFFSTPPYSRSKTTSKVAEVAASDKQTVKKTSKGRKTKAGPNNELSGLATTTSGNKENAPAKLKRTRKKSDKPGPGEEKVKNKTITGKVTKSGTSKPKAHSKASGPEAADGKKSRREGSAGKEDAGLSENDDLQLEPAMKRRLDWTPTKERSEGQAVELENKEDPEAGQGGLGGLISAYGYTGICTASERAQIPIDMGPTKRRRIELVDSRVLPVKPLPLVEESPQADECEGDDSAVSKPNKKPKTRTKRLTTLTARVTAPYREASTDSSDPAGQRSSGAAGTSGATKGEARTRKTANEISSFKVPREIVLSPGEAVKSLDEQDLVFGTCSQLERAESPTFLKDMQAALQESEMESCASSLRIDKPSDFSRTSSAISRLATRKNLWSIAARDTEGSVINVEVVDLVGSPEIPKATAQSCTDDSKKDHERDETRSVRDASSTISSAPSDLPINMELSEPTSQAVEQPVSSRPKVIFKRPMPHYKGMTDLHLAKNIHSYGFKPIKNRNKMIDTLEQCWIAKHGPPSQEEAEEPQLSEKPQAAPPSSPSFESLAEVKPKKTNAVSQRSTRPQPRPQIVPQATKEDSEITTSSRPTTTNTADDIKQPITKNSSQRGSQQPLKRSFIDVEEIQDSEDDELPSPSRILNQFLGTPPRREEKNKKQKQELPTSPIHLSPRSPLKNTQAKTKASKTKASEEDLPDLGAQITKAVRAQSRQGSMTQSPAGRRKKPSFHEKILMYDPIYLEDLTAWLNTEGLGLVDDDREVNAGFVRQWCESKGICCCYRVKKAGRPYQ